MDDDAARQTGCIDASNIRNSTIKNEMKQITFYEPRNIKEVAITLSLVLKDEVLVYERARRLTPAERDKVNDVICN